MSGVVIPDPRGGHVWIYGIDAGGDPVRLLVDADGHLQVDVLTTIAAVTVADGADVTQGALADAVVAAGAAGSVSAKLRRLTTDLGALLTELKLKADLTETQPVSIATMPTTTVQAAGGDKLFSFESIVEEGLSNTNLDAGDNTLSGTVVASGKVQKLTQMAMWYNGTVPTRVLVWVVGLASGLYLMDQASPTSGQRYFWSGEVYVQAGDYVTVKVEDATAGDDLYFRYTGVQMDAP